MTPSALNTLFGIPASPTTATKPASNTTAFGDMLSREMNGRQNAAPAPSNLRPDNPPAASRAPQPTPAAASKPAERQIVNSAQKQQTDAPGKEQQTDASPTDSAARGNADDARTVAKNAAADAADKPAKASKKDKSEKSDKVDDSDSTAEAADPTAVSAASADLLALVASMMPKATATAAAAAKATAVAIDPAAAATAAATAVMAGAIVPNATAAKGAQVTLTTDPVAGAAEPTPADPAFDALVAQAVNSSAARGHARAEPSVGKTNSSSESLPAARTDTDAAQARSNITPAAVLTTNAGEIVLAAAAVQAASSKAEPAALAGVPGLAGAVPAGLTQAAGGTPPDTLTPHVGTPAWDHALGQKVVWMAAGALQSASLTLNPPELGPVQVVINVSNDQASASFTAAQPEVRQALEAAMPRLKEMLGDAGITLGQASVNAGNPNQYGAADQQSGNSARHGKGDGGIGQEPPHTDPIKLSPTRIGSSGTGLVDTFA